MKQFRSIGLIALVGVGLLGTLAPAHAQWSPGYSPYSFGPYTSSITGTVIFNTGSQLVVRTASGDLNVYLRSHTTVMGVNNVVLPLGAIGTGSQVEIYGSVVAGGIVADSIIVLSSSLYGGSYFQTPLIPLVAPPVIYQDLWLDWPTFVRRHPHDWPRWRGHWHNFHRRGHHDWDRWRDHDWRRDWDGRRDWQRRGHHQWQGRQFDGRIEQRGDIRMRGDLFDRLERRQHERRNINR
ncbi:hypothetical protein HY620_00495 [Candidatus Uhrbacteria bacterium]|nr:hypothetical protein [Candidatus Uhrbacteria bacterium]